MPRRSRAERPNRRKRSRPPADPGPRRRGYFLNIRLIKKGIQTPTAGRIAALVVILCIGLFLRLDRLPYWLEHKGDFFINDQQTPVMLGIDSYYYMDIARQIMDGGYQPFDPRRRFPDGHQGAAHPPLMSVALAGICTLTGVSLDWVAMLLAPFFGALIAIPAYLLGKSLAGQIRADRFPPPLSKVSASTIMGLVTAFFMVTSPYLVRRSAVGWCDTDFMNVTFAVFATVCALQIIDAKRLSIRIGWGTSWIVTFVLFGWWWDQASMLPVLFLAGVPMFFSAVFLMKEDRKYRLPGLLVLALFLIGLRYFAGPEIFDPSRYLDKVLSILRYITGTDAAQSAFFGSGAQVSEQLGFNWRELTEAVGGATWFGLLGLAGFLAFCVMTWRRLPWFAPLVVVALLAFTGRRFTIFCTPIYGLGWGFIAWLIWHVKPHKRLRYAAILVLVISGGLVVSDPIKAYRQHRALRPTQLLQAMADAKTRLPEDAVIWTTWGHGHPLTYYTNRATMADGMYHPASMRYVLNFPLGADNFRLAANWISFCVAHGEKGCHKANELFGEHREDWATGMPTLQDLLREGPQESRALLAQAGRFDDSKIEEILQFLFPGSSRPIILLIEQLMLDSGSIIQGWWDFDKKESPSERILFPLYDLKPVNATILAGQSYAGPVQVDIRNGSMQLGTQKRLLDHISVFNAQRPQVTRYPRNANGVVKISAPPAPIGIYCDTQSANSVFARLFFDQRSDPRYITPVDIGVPYYAFWRVTGEAYKPW